MNTPDEKKEKPKKEAKLKSATKGGSKGGKNDKKEDEEKKGGGGNDTHTGDDPSENCEERTTYFMATDAVLGFPQRCPLVTEALALHLASQCKESTNLSFGKPPVTTLRLNSDGAHFWYAIRLVTLYHSATHSTIRMCPPISKCPMPYPPLLTIARKSTV